MRSQARTRHEVVARRLALIPLPGGALGTAAESDPASPGSSEAGDSLEAAPLLPVVGRHAHQARWLPGFVRGRVGIEPWHGVVVAGVAVVALSLCCVWLLVRSPHVVSPGGVGVVPAPALTPMAASGVPGSAAAGAEARVTVDVVGKVRRPGVRTLPARSRVVDALRAAGGTLRGVDLTSLNQARVLVDGEQIVVGRRAGGGGGGGGVVSGGAGGGTGAASSGVGVATTLVNLNTASLTELDTLPGVGPVTAQAIVAYRDQHGGFGAVAELLEVDGIGEVTLARLEPRVTV